MIDKKIAISESAVIISGTVGNNGLQKMATGYVVFSVIDPYHPRVEIFNSHKHLSFSEKRNLLIYDVKPGTAEWFSFTWPVPKSFFKPVLYIKIDVWSPRKLYNKKGLFYYPYKFDTSGWKGFIEIVENTTSMKKIKIFISYTWISPEHRQWVLGLADMLVKHGFDIFIDRDLLPGQEITKFMEKKIDEAEIILLVCSQVYTQKANERIEGTGYETVIATRKYYSIDDKEKFIPITKDNNLPPAKKLPAYLGKTLYIDMDIPAWQGEPFQKLVQAIKRHA